MQTVLLICAALVIFFIWGQMNDNDRDQNNNNNMLIIAGVGGTIFIWLLWVTTSFKDTSLTTAQLSTDVDDLVQREEKTHKYWQEISKQRRNIAYLRNILDDIQDQTTEWAKKYNYMSKLNNDRYKQMIDYIRIAVPNTDFQMINSNENIEMNPTYVNKDKYTPNVDIEEITEREPDEIQVKDANHFIMTSREIEDMNDQWRDMKLNFGDPDVRDFARKSELEETLNNKNTITTIIALKKNNVLDFRWLKNNYVTVKLNDKSYRLKLSSLSL